LFLVEKPLGHMFQGLRNQYLVQTNHDEKPFT
jgi:hypothetical protein